MTKFIVRAIFNGTSKHLAVPAQKPGVALAKAMVSKNAKGAQAFVVYERKSGNPVLTYAM